MAGFKKPPVQQPTAAGEPTQTQAPTPAQPTLQRNPKEEQLGVFRSLVIRMSKAGKTPQEIVQFMYNPSAATFGEKSSEFNAAFYAGIMNYTTPEERMQILEELSEAGLV